MRCDVLVVGAGPAGSALAARLAADGFSVLLADKKAFPRDKPCGEFLSPECAPYLDALGATDAVAALGPRLVRGMRLHGYGVEAAGRFRGLLPRGATAEHGIGIRRARFDAVLVDAAVRAGARWLPRHEFVGLRRGDDGRISGATLRGPDGAPIECEARWVVGADGVHSRIARALGVQRPVPWLDQFALVAHFAEVEAQPLAEVHLFPGGFFAATTVDAGLFSVNLVVPRRTLRQRAAPDWDAFVAGHFDRAPAFGQRLAAARRTTPWRGIGPLAFRTTAQTFAGAALVGDACGYLDPLTGEGIYFALFGARALGDALHGALHSPAQATAAMAAYTASRRREIAPRLAASAALQRALRHPWLVRGFLAAAARWPALADLVVTLTGDTVHPRELWRPSFWRAFRAAAPATAP
ncbi:MAG: NAD(P)/FAD-dependent oxidoreductase [Planctomycetes bacterium]|nr:NAD(P)/FAD-dependent oxidoreductase [Planctomycetota bacterium]